MKRRFFKAEKRLRTDRTGGKPDADSLTIHSFFLWPENQAPCQSGGGHGGSAADGCLKTKARYAAALKVDRKGGHH